MAMQPSAVLAEEEPLELAPSSRWTLSYDNEACRLGRTFGEGDTKVMLVLEKYQPGTRIDVLASGIPLKTNNKRKLVYRFDPQEGDREDESPLFGEAENGGTIWQFSTGLIPADRFKELQGDDAATPVLRQAEKEAASGIESMSITGGVRQPVRLATGSLGPPMEAMDGCLDDLVKSWGFDPAEQAALSTGPKPLTDAYRWMAPFDYPTDALRRELSGVVRFRMTVDTQGHATDCVIQSSYSDPSFSDLVCKALMRKARFSPALNAAGEPVVSYWGTAVKFLVR